MKITVNGEDRDVPTRTSLRTLVDHPQGVAIALNGEVVPAARWERAALHPGDVVEIVTARQGG